MRSALLTALVLVAVSATAAQESALSKPDFSGRWVRQDGRGSVLAVIQDAAVISVTSQLSSGPSVMTYGLDGREIHSIDRTAVPAVPGSRRPFAGDVQVSKGEWRGTDLVLSDTYASGSTQTQVWSLDSSGVLHVEVIKGPPDRPDSRHTVTFTRQ